MCFIFLFNQAITFQQFSGFRHMDTVVTKFKLSPGMREKGDICNFKCGMVFGVRWALLRFSETANLLGFTENGLEKK